MQTSVAFCDYLYSFINGVSLESDGMHQNSHRKHLDAFVLVTVIECFYFWYSLFVSLDDRCSLITIGAVT